ncbi:hypothetical protein K7W03_16160 [Sphingobium sp. PNB]|uniref:hypothetical protein n=1 Tax=Sphingobium sp. PNB TaxID=863934 RepID=UPI001CA3B3B7|nr:hypothetical protein [Sphingobium sp. PNB]MCB4861126.1 hypothetical protein [Sphingobium sp. PNB]
MKSTDLEAEMAAAANSVRQAHIDRMIALGVPGASIAALGAMQPAFGISPAAVEPSYFYQPVDGPTHVVMPVMDQGEMIDLIAWRSSNPARWFWRTGLGWALGTDWLLPRWDNGPVKLYATPLEWLAGAGEGICVLDWSAPEIRDLAALEAIEADELIGRRLISVLSKPARMPRVTYRKAVQRAA